jgi:transcriptional regulator with GAF, ATPase, and Fis domain
MFSSNPMLWRRPGWIWKYGAAVLSVAAAMFVSHWPLLHLEAAPVSLFLCAVMFSAWFGGAGPGLLATILSALAFYYGFLPPVYSLASKPEQIPRFIIFVVSALFVGALSVAQRRATESLRGARDDLNETVQQLRKTNDALGKSEAYLKNAFEEIQALRDQLYKENVALREEIDITRMFEEIVGSSPALQAVLAQVAKVAPTDSTVLITGETGTGKELIARAIHKRSQRSSRAFVSVNCAAIPRDLIASELFGHEKGAFTGATQRRLGRFESAEGGTIFLDEVGELPAETQIALLRVLQEREYQRVGGNESLKTDVRVVAATNRDLQGAIAEGRFREDLFYRLNVFPIEVPPLRDRKEDIPLLVEYFVDRYASKAGKKITGINKKSMELLRWYQWPGNIRELQNVIERSVIVCDSENLSVDESWLARRAIAGDSPAQPLSEKLAAQEKELIEAALEESKGRVSGPLGAAAKLGIPQSTLDSKIKSLKINKHQFRKP